MSIRGYESYCHAYIGGTTPYSSVYMKEGDVSKG
ncbi:hypothetical protein A2U01_0080807, partial [Trifolium medium]|nr:hypothetical protein [Trifolium medium]